MPIYDIDTFISYLFPFLRGPGNFNDFPEKIRKNFLDWTIKKTQAYEIRRVFFSFKMQSIKFINRSAIYSLFYQVP